MNKRTTTIIGVVLVAILLVFAGCQLRKPAATTTTTTAPAMKQTVGTPAPSAAKSPATKASASAATGKDPVSGLRWVELSSLPKEASDTMKEIKDGPPYPYPSNDGVTYHNNNGVLPKKADGYYKEFTVPTPGASNRGARRIIAGSGGEYYYTGDHYTTFERIHA